MNRHFGGTGVFTLTTKQRMGKKPEGIITNLMQVISVLESKMRKLEWELRQSTGFWRF